MRKDKKIGKAAISWMLAAALFCMAANPAPLQAVEAAPLSADVDTETASENGEPAEADAVEAAGQDIEAIGADSPANPVHHCTKKNDGSDWTRWSYVYFGSYPQSEAAGEELTEDITGAEFDANGDAWVNDAKYRRISRSDTNNNVYFGDQQYRYFKWEPIRWRVLKNDGGKLFVMADQGLDCKDYHDPGNSVTWENSTVRSWLNKDFYETAFSEAEQSAIAEQTIENEDNPEYWTYGGNSTQDKVFLLSVEEAENPSYGFCDDYDTYSASRRLKGSDYAHARGAFADTDAAYAGNCWWWLRSPGSTTSDAARVDDRGDVNRDGFTVFTDSGACVPALHINLSSDLWYDGGDNGLDPLDPLQDQEIKKGDNATFRVTAGGSEQFYFNYQWYHAPSLTGEGTPIEGAVSSSYTVNQADETMDGGYYYCVVGDGASEATTSRARLSVLPANPVHHCTKDNNGADTSDWSYVYFGSYPQVEVAGSALTDAIAGASYDADGDAWVDGVKYRKVPAKNSWGQDRYFQWRRIRWRVLENDGGKLLLMADRGLDYKDYHDQAAFIDWEHCELRNWLNNDFYTTAFSAKEQAAITEQTVVNEDNGDTNAGNDTEDRIFLLSVGEAQNPAYGFCEYSGSSEVRKLKPSEYANVLGVFVDASGTSDWEGGCYWWLRSPGSSREKAAYVSPGGYIRSDGRRVSGESIGSSCAPVLRMEISSGLWHWNDDGTSGDGGKEVVAVTSVLLGKTSLSLKTGETAELSASVLPANTTYRAVAWSSSRADVAEIKENGKGGVTVTAKKAGTAQITAECGGKTASCTVSVTEKSSGGSQGGGDNPGGSGGSQGGGDNPGGSGGNQGGGDNPGGSGGSQGGNENPGGGNNPGGNGGSGTGGGQTTDSPLKAPKLKIKLSGTNAVKLTWGKVKGAAGYAVYRANSKKGKYKKIASSKKTSYTDKKLKSGKTYYYKVAAVKGKKAGAQSNIASKKIPQKPATPKQNVIRIDTKNGKFTISWNKVKNADKIVILRRVDKGKFKVWKTVSARKKTASFSYQRFERGHRYSFQIRAYCTKEKIKIYSGYSNIYTMVM